MSKQQTGVRVCHMIDATDAQDEGGVVVPIPTRDRLPDLQEAIDGVYVSKNTRAVGTDLLDWAVREIRFQRSLAKRYRELASAS